MSDTTYREQLKKAYSDANISENYIKERFDSAMGRILHEAQVVFVAGAIATHKVSKVLEIAPGPARLTVDIGRKCAAVHGTIVDVNINMLQEALHRLESAGLAKSWRVVAGDAFSLPFDDFFDLIYSFRFVRHFHAEDRAKVYGQIYEHLSAEGLLIFDVINFKVSNPIRLKEGAEHYPIYDELYTFPQLQDELNEHRFRIVDHVSVQRCYWLQRLIQIWIGPRSQKLAYMLMKIIEKTNIGQPLEWIVLCQKI